MKLMIPHYMEHYSRVGHFLEMLADKSAGWSKDLCLELVRDFLIVDDAFNVVNQGKHNSFPPYAFVLGRLLRKQGQGHLFDGGRRAPAKEESMQAMWDELAAVDERLRQ